MKTYTIGRNPKSDIVINKESVSNEHAELIVLEDKWLIKDNHSSNGVWVNRRRVAQAKISMDDELLIANQRVDLKKYLRIVDDIVLGVKPPDDMSDYFNNLQSIEAKFETENDRLDKSASAYMTAFRLSFLATAVSGVLIRMLITDNLLIYILLSTIGFGLLSLYFFIASNKAVRKKEKKKKILRDQHKIEYICPNCNQFIPDSTYMMTLKTNYRCRSCKVVLYHKMDL